MNEGKGAFLCPAGGARNKQSVENNNLLWSSNRTSAEYLNGKQRQISDKNPHQTNRFVSPMHSRRFTFAVRGHVTPLPWTPCRKTFQGRIISQNKTSVCVCVCGWIHTCGPDFPLFPHGQRFLRFLTCSPEESLTELERDRKEAVCAL